MTPTAAFTTLGCRLNQAESDVMAEDLAAAGIGPASPGVAPDVVVVNTCTVTREATKASRTAIRRAVRDHPDARVVVVGCYAVSNPDEVAQIDGVDVVLGNSEKDALARALAGEVAVAPLLKIGMRKPTAVRGRVRANLKIQTGCDEWCTFCIIPTTRGPLRSYEPDDLVAQARRRVAAGARELVLTGVHLGKFSYDSGGDELALVKLFERLLEIEGVTRLRLSSILSRHLTDEVLSFMASEPRMCRYLHVPLQSGHDDVLRAMHRPYAAAEYVTAVERAKEMLPGLALATDIIVGFPGESDAAFEATLDVVRRIEFAKLHVFRYSPRPETPAASMGGEVPAEVKRVRSKQLIDLGNELRRRFLDKHLGRDLEVLVEDEREVDGLAVASGQTDDYVRVWFEGRGLLGKLVSVRGTGLRADGIKGAIVSTIAQGG